MTRKGFHTQEKRVHKLESPIICDADDAWLGRAYYFWINEDDANFWGLVKKKRTGYFEVYSCLIDCENVLDTVFSEEHYSFWLKNIEKVATNFVKKTNVKPTIKELNDYLTDKGVWSTLDGIMFQDISKNQVHYLVTEFQYKKRIQIALFNKDKISTFAHHYTGQCV